MKTLPLALGLTLGSLAAGLHAADAPARRNRPPVTASPEILDDHRIVFRMQAPQAREVLVLGQWTDGRASLARNDEGVWETTVGPIAPGVYEYSFSVDGLRMIDPGNPAIKPMRQPRTSILHLPGNPPLVHDFQDVPHGVVRSHSYWSRSLDRLRALTVYTPPGYDAAPDRRYPTLYLQHGSGDNQDTWTVHGKAHWILDNLLAADRAQPMIVVMMDGHASLEREGNTAAFERDLFEDVLPMIEAAYRPAPGAENRGIVGLSMGGGQSLTVGLNHLDRFAWVGGFSSSAPSVEQIATALQPPARTRERLRLLWIACGRDDFLLDRNQAFVAALKEGGIPHEWHLTGGNHSWPVWRGYLAEFLPRLFR
ncbi:MAG: esterase [Verrucomicrobiales bacterium]|nr:esterase [Verrucomicrobiales bacterium]MCP5525196.1 esterase [Verrucomicrobiales bacterium]